MERSNIFISYSHKDRGWLERLTEQLAALQRRGLVDVWSDELIAVGSAWGEAINTALSRARIAILLVSPSYLASKFIWESEIPRIQDHAAKGMEALPLIIRPCAWQLEPFLAGLQARPPEGRALSLGNESQIDTDLTSFVTELASKIEHTKPWHFDARGEWDGNYGSNTSFVLNVQEQQKDKFSGTMTYTGGTITKIEGTLSAMQKEGGASDRGLVQVAFKETAHLRSDSGEVDLNGEYRGTASQGLISGAWFNKEERRLGDFVLKRDPQ
jgi:hypothetical protein